MLYCSTSSVKSKSYIVKIEAYREAHGGLVRPAKACIPKTLQKHTPTQTRGRQPLRKNFAALAGGFLVQNDFIHI